MKNDVLGKGYSFINGVQVVGERYAMVTFKKVASEGFMQNAEDIKHCLKAITEKVYSLIRTYSRTFRWVQWDAYNCGIGRRLLKHDVDSLINMNQCNCTVILTHFIVYVNF